MISSINSGNSATFLSDKVNLHIFMNKSVAFIINAMKFENKICAID